MPKILPDEFRRRKNLLEAPGMIHLFEVYVAAGETLFLTDWNTNITFGGVEYIRFPMRLGSISETSTGEIDRVDLEVSNVTKEVQYYIENYDALRRKKVVIKTVFEDKLDDPTEFYLDVFYVEKAVATSISVGFTLSSTLNILDVKIPFRVYLRDQCQNTTKEECEFVGVCNHTIDECRERGMTAKCDACPSIPMGRIIIA